MANSKVSEAYRRSARNWNMQAQTGEIKDEDNPLFIFSLTTNDLLRKIANGELDTAQLALLELESRGLVERDYYTYDRKGKKRRVKLPY